MARNWSRSRKKYVDSAKGGVTDSSTNNEKDTFFQTSNLFKKEKLPRLQFLTKNVCDIRSRLGRITHSKYVVATFMSMEKSNASFPTWFHALADGKK